MAQKDQIMQIHLNIILHLAILIKVLITSFSFKRLWFIQIRSISVVINH